MNLNQTVTDRVYSQIKKKIINLEMKLGQRIDIKELSNHFNVSQTPIREALSLLIKDELLEYKPRQGYYVVDLSCDGIEEIYELRELIECFALKQAIKKGNIDKDIFNQLLEKLKRIQKETNKEKRLLDYHVSGKELHLSIVKSSSNNKLYNVYLRIYPFVSISQHLDPMYERALDEHIQIIHHILDGDVLKAVNILRHHINNGKKRGLIAFKQQL